MNIRAPIDKVDFELYYNFRWKNLRKPLGQKEGTEKDELENESYHLMIVDGDNILGVGRIHFIVNNLNKKAQIRYMAIDQNFQKRGCGSLLLKELEAIALTKKVKHIFLHSRESAVHFYLKNKYKKIKKSHILLGQIQHWYMEKEL